MSVKGCAGSVCSVPRYHTFTDWLWAPRYVFAFPHNNAVQLDIDDAYPAYMQYDVRISPGGSIVHFASGAGGLIVGGLVNGTSYTFKVRARFATNPDLGGNTDRVISAWSMPTEAISPSAGA